MATLTKKKQKHKPADKFSNSDEPELETKKQMKPPPFVSNFKHKSDPDSPKTKVNDRNIWNGVTNYFCGFSRHKDKLKWHTHTAKHLHTPKRWLDRKSDTGTSPPDSNYPSQANVADK